VNENKSNHEPVRRIQWLGFIMDSNECKYYVSEEKLTLFNSVIDMLLIVDSRLTAHVFSSLRRSMPFCASVIVRSSIFVSLRITWLLAFLILNVISIARTIQLRLQVSLICLIIVQFRRHSVNLICYVAHQRRKIR